MASRNRPEKSEFVFAALGGIGEIGMNLYLYGYGPAEERTWLMIDLGITFPTEVEPGVDVILPDIGFLEEERHNLAGILLTHAHEDHYGAMVDLWPRLGGAPVYATPFTAAMLRSKLKETSFGESLPLQTIPMGGTCKIGPFEIELIAMSHSIPEPSAVLIRTPLGNALHTGDWKIDETPLTSAATDEPRLREIGAEGLDTLICDSTNAMREGISPSERDVGATLERLIREAPRRVAVTTFASNVARILSVAKAARAAGRELVVVGRAMYRVIEAAQETGYLQADFRYRSEIEFQSLPPSKVVALCTGSQGEPRAAMARIAQDAHPNVSLDAGDHVIFSSRTIPGNERIVSRVQNSLADREIEVITDRDALVHVSGHPRRGELEQLYSWLKPHRAVPMHGEGRHLEAHAEFAEALHVPEVLRIRNGDLLRLAPEPAEVIDSLPTGRLYRDGTLLLSADESHVRARRKLAFSGMISVSVVLSDRGALLDEPRVATVGVPSVDANGTPLDSIAIDAAIGALESIPKPRRKDTSMVSDAIRRSVRAAINQAWGKKPICSVLVTML